MPQPNLLFFSQSEQRAFSVCKISIGVHVGTCAVSGKQVISFKFGVFLRNRADSENPNLGGFLCNALVSEIFV